MGQSGRDKPRKLGNKLKKIRVDLLKLFSNRNGKGARVDGRIYGGISLWARDARTIPANRAQVRRDS